MKIIYLYLGALFLANLVIASHEVNNNDEAAITNDLIARKALLFLSDDKLRKKGNKFDCSTFAYYVYKQCKIEIPKSASDQYLKGIERVPETAIKGDLVFFKINKKQISHVGIYLEDGAFIHSPGRNKEVRIDSLNQQYWKTRLAGYRTYQ